MCAPATSGHMETCMLMQVKLWDVPRGKLLREFKGPTQHTDQVTAVAWMPDGQSFLSSSLDRCAGNDPCHPVRPGGRHILHVCTSCVLL